MSRKKSGGGSVFTFKTPGDVLEAYYVGTQEVPSKFDDRKTALKHTFKTKAGEIKVVFGSSVLNNNLEGETPGAFVRIEYVCDKPSDKRGRHPTKIFDSEWFDDDQLDSSEVMSAYTSSTEEEPDYGSDDIVPSDEVITAAARSAPKAAAPTEEQRRKVQELVRRRTG